jgi:hypothetical protein
VLLCEKRNQLEKGGIILLSIVKLKVSSINGAVEQNITRYIDLTLLLLQLFAFGIRCVLDSKDLLPKIKAKSCHHLSIFCRQRHL